MHRDENKAHKVDGTQITKDLNAQLIYMDFFHEFNKKLLKVLSQKNSIMSSYFREMSLETIHLVEGMFADG